MVQALSALIDQVTQQLLDSPAVEATILNAFADTHAAFLGDGEVPDRIDLTPVAQVARENLVSASPELDSGAAGGAGSGG